MKIIPILYSTPMVQAIQKNRKTKTRRTKRLEKVNEKPNEWILDGVQLMDSYIFHNIISRDEFWVKCPYGSVGDILWVRETFHKYESEQKGVIYSFLADNLLIKNARIWKPSIHMPKVAARIFLQIKSIKIERLQDITEADAIAEGINMRITPIEYETVYQIPNWTNFFPTAKKAFFVLWQSINGKESIDLNPWVWVIEFDNVEKPENFI